MVRFGALVALFLAFLVEPISAGARQRVASRHHRGRSGHRHARSRTAVALRGSPRGENSQITEELRLLHKEVDDQKKLFVAQREQNGHLEREVQQLKQELSGEVHKEQVLEQRQQTLDKKWVKLQKAFSDDAVAGPTETGSTVATSPLPKRLSESSSTTVAMAPVPSAVKAEKPDNAAVASDSEDLEEDSNDAEEQQQQLQTTPAMSTTHAPAVTTSAKIVVRAHAKRAEARHQPAKTLPRTVSHPARVHLEHKSSKVLKRWKLQKPAKASEKTSAVQAKDGDAVSKEADNAVPADDDSGASPFDALEDQLQEENKKIDELAGDVDKDSAVAADGDGAAADETVAKPSGSKGHPAFIAATKSVDSQGDDGSSADMGSDADLVTVPSPAASQGAAHTAVALQLSKHGKHAVKEEKASTKVATPIPAKAPAAAAADADDDEDDEQTAKFLRQLTGQKDPAAPTA